MATTKAPTPPVATPPTSTPSKLATIAKMVLAAILWPFKMLWALVLKTWGATVWFKNLMLDYKAILIGVVLGLLTGLSCAAYLLDHRRPVTPAAPAKIVPAAAVLDTNKLSAQISLLSAQIENIRQILLLRASGGPVTPQAIVTVPAADPDPVMETQAPKPAKHRAPKKAAATSGWFQ